MAQWEKGKYVSPKAQVIVLQCDAIRTSDGSETGESLMDWSEGWGTIQGGNE